MRPFGKLVIHASYHPPWNSEHDRAWRDFHPLGQNGSGANDAALSHGHACQQHRAHSDQAIRFDPAAVQDRAVADGDTRSDDARKLLVDMNDDEVLDIAVLADNNRSEVGTQYRPVPDTCLRLECDIPKEHGRGSDERGRIDPIDRPRVMT